MAGHKTTCCVVGGGPAGMVLGYLLARAGVRVTVLEKHKDFFRDFRGDTVHPSTLELIDELGLLDEFLKVPHQELTTLGAVFGDYSFRVADFRRLKTRCKFVGLMPQWDFLDFFAAQVKKLPKFELLMEHEAVGLLPDGSVDVAGRDPISADLVVACDGRGSVIRKAAGLEVEEVGVPIDVLWFRLSRKPDDPADVLGNLNYGSAMVLINRGDYFQTAFIIRKGSFDEVRARGLEAFREKVALVAPFLRERMAELGDWEQVKLLSVQINRLQRWYKPGLLCIGDAAHAMSPVGGVGINLAVQDAVAAARMLAGPLLAGRVDEVVLERIQKRRIFPTKLTQRLQVNAHKGLQYVFDRPGPLRAPVALRVVTKVPGLPYLIARLVGIGVRPEHFRG